MTVQVVDASRVRAVEAALRYLGALRLDDHVGVIERAMIRPDESAATVLAPLTDPTSVLSDWATADRAHALWQVVHEGVLDLSVSRARSRERHALQAAFRLRDDEIRGEWGASLADRFRQLGDLPEFSNLHSTQPMEIAWKRGVERLADHLHGHLGALRTPEDWARYKPAPAGRRGFRAPSEGAQKLIANLIVVTVLMRGRGEHRRFTERLITSQDAEGLRYFRAWAMSSSEHRLDDPTYSPVRALWGCRAEQVVENGMASTRLWFPRPLRVGQRGHFIAEAVLDDPKDVERGWVNVTVDHHGIERGEIREDGIPTSGLTIRIRFEREALPTAVWWYAEQNELERYEVPPAHSARRLRVDKRSGQVWKTFEDPCEPRESYGIAYTWADDANGLVT